MRGLLTRRSRTAGPAPEPASAPDQGPAGLEPQDPAVPPEPSFKDRGRLRRRLRHLRRVRELGFRDLGGLVFDLHRFGRRGDALVAQKLNALAAVDRELRALERALQDQRPFHELREPGLAACPRCAAIHGSDARFCPACGTNLRGPLAVGEVGATSPPPSQVIAAPAGAALPTPASADDAQPPAAPAVVTEAQAGSTPVSTALESEGQPTEGIPAVEQPDAPATPSDQQDAERPPSEAHGPDDITVVQRPGDAAT